MRTNFFSQVPKDLVLVEESLLYPAKGSVRLVSDSAAGRRVAVVRYTWSPAYVVQLFPLRLASRTPILARRRRSFELSSPLIMLPFVRESSSDTHQVRQG